MLIDLLLGEQKEWAVAVFEQHKGARRSPL